MKPENNPIRSHPIGVVSNRTGLSKDVIRIWERRYNIIEPLRDQSKRRLYSDKDIERLSLLKRAVDMGRRISDLAGLDNGNIKDLLLEDSGYSVEPRSNRQTAASNESVENVLQQCFHAVQQSKLHELHRILTESSVHYSRPQLRNGIILPLITAIGEGWSNGTVRIHQEHLASVVLKSFLSDFRTRARIADNAPRIIVTTPAGQMHELGASIAAEVAVESGWDAMYLGPDLPAEEIAASVIEQRAVAVALSIVYPDNDPYLRDELRKLRVGVGDGIKIFTGGSANGSYQKVIEEIEAVSTTDFREFSDHLKRILLFTKA